MMCGLPISIALWRRPGRRFDRSGGVFACDWPRRPRQHINFGHGKPAQTHYRRLDTSATQSRLLLTPYTGRSHQLRVHCASLGHPILGCEFYADASTRDASPRLLLHASALQLLHPVSGEALSLHCEPPF